MIPSVTWPHRLAIKPVGLDGALGWGYALIAAIGVAVAPFSTAEQSTTLISSAALTALILTLYFFLKRTNSGRPLRLVGLVLLIGALQPAALVLSTVLEGDVIYFTQLGGFSHHVDSLHVALVYAVFYLTSVSGAWLISLLFSRRPSPGWPVLTRQLSPSHLQLAAAMAVLVAFLRIAALFPANIGVVPAYFARVFVGYFAPLSFFVGVSLRRGGRWAIPALVCLLVPYGFVLVGGNRGDALVPMAFVLVGYLVSAERSSRWKVHATLTAAAVLGAGAMYAGAALREDQEGRSGAAALERLDSIGERLSESDTDGVRASVVRRMLRNSTHAILSMVPDRFPFEREGLRSLPAEMSANLLPGLHFEGRASGKEARNWMLNELGFMVNWETSVELAVVPDAWARNGWLGIVVVGLILGLVLQLAEEAVYLDIAQKPLKQVLLIALTTASIMCEGKDIVWGLRSLLWTFLAGSLAVWLMSALARGVPVGAQTVRLDGVE